MMKRVAWILLAAGLLVTAPITALAVAAIQAKESCDTDAWAMNKAETSTPAQLILHIRNENVKAFYNVCAVDASGVNWGRYEFSLGPGQERTLRWDLPITAVEYRVGFGGMSFGGATHSTARIDLARCPDHVHEAIFVARAEPSRYVGDLTPVRCRPEDQSGLSSVQEQTILPAPRLPPVTAALAFWSVGGGTILLGASWLLWQRSRWVLAVGLFTRLTQPDVLQQRVRGLLRDLVASDPGIHVQAIANRLELSRGVVTYHLGVLCRNRVLTHVALPGHVSYFVRGEYAPHRMRQLAVLRSPSVAKALEVIRSNAGITLDALGRTIGTSPSRASKVAKRLVQAGLVRKSLDRRRARFHPL